MLKTRTCSSHIEQHSMKCFFNYFSHKTIFVIFLSLMRLELFKQQQYKKAYSLSSIENLVDRRQSGTCKIISQIYYHSPNFLLMKCYSQFKLVSDLFIFHASLSRNFSLFYKIRENEKVSNIFLKKFLNLLKLLTKLVSCENSLL